MIRVNWSNVLRVCPGLLAVVLLAGACSDSLPTEAAAPAASSFSLRSNLSGDWESPGHGSSLLACPRSVTSSSSATVGPNGGTVALEGVSITVPPGALKRRTKLTVVLPASAYAIVELYAGEGGHIAFRKPISATISYAACSRQNVMARTLNVVYLDSNTGEPLEEMRSADSKADQTVTFVTTHFSTYAVAY